MFFTHGNEEMNKKPPYWFRVRDPKYGVGWGLPLMWQGWVVFITYLSLLLGGAILLVPGNLPAYLGAVALATVIFFVICLWKGEPLGKQAAGHRK